MRVDCTGAAGDTPHPQQPRVPAASNAATEPLTEAQSCAISAERLDRLPPMPRGLYLALRPLLPANSGPPDDDLGPTLLAPVIPSETRRMDRLLLPEDSPACTPATPHPSLQLAQALQATLQAGPPPPSSPADDSGGGSGNGNGSASTAAEHPARRQSVPLLRPLPRLILRPVRSLPCSALDAAVAVAAAPDRIQTNQHSTAQEHFPAGQGTLPQHDSFVEKVLLWRQPSSTAGARSAASPPSAAPSGIIPGAVPLRLSPLLTTGARSAFSVPAPPSSAGNATPASPMPPPAGYSPPLRQQQPQHQHAPPPPAARATAQGAYPGGRFSDGDDGDRNGAGDREHDRGVSPGLPAVRTGLTLPRGPIEVTVAVRAPGTGLSRPRGGAVQQPGMVVTRSCYVRGPVCGRFDVGRYLADRDCIMYEGSWMSRSNFEKLGGSKMAKWYRSIRVLPDLEPLGEWLERHQVPVARGPNRRSVKRPLDSGDELWLELAAAYLGQHGRRSTSCEDSPDPAPELPTAYQHQVAGPTAAGTTAARGDAWSGGRCDRSAGAAGGDGEQLRLWNDAADASGGGEGGSFLRRLLNTLPAGQVLPPPQLTASAHAGGMRAPQTLSRARDPLAAVSEGAAPAGPVPIHPSAALSADTPQSVRSVRLAESHPRPASAAGVLQLRPLKQPAVGIDRDGRPGELPGERQQASPLSPWPANRAVPGGPGGNTPAPLPRQPPQAAWAPAWHSPAAVVRRLQSAPTPLQPHDGQLAKEDAPAPEQLPAALNASAGGSPQPLVTRQAVLTRALPLLPLDRLLGVKRGREDSDKGTAATAARVANQDVRGVPEARRPRTGEQQQQQQQQAWVAGGNPAASSRFVFEEPENATGPVRPRLHGLGHHVHSGRRTGAQDRGDGLGQPLLRKGGGGNGAAAAAASAAAADVPATGMGDEHPAYKANTSTRVEGTQLGARPSLPCDESSQQLCGTVGPLQPQPQLQTQPQPPPPRPHPSQFHHEQVQMRALASCIWEGADQQIEVGAWQELGSEHGSADDPHAQAAGGEEDSCAAGQDRASGFGPQVEPEIAPEDWMMSQPHEPVRAVLGRPEAMGGVREGEGDGGSRQGALVAERQAVGSTELDERSGGLQADSPLGNASVSSREDEAMQSSGGADDLQLVDLRSPGQQGPSSSEGLREPALSQSGAEGLLTQRPKEAPPQAPQRQQQAAVDQSAAPPEPQSEAAPTPDTKHTELGLGPLPAPPPELWPPRTVPQAARAQESEKPEHAAELQAATQGPSLMTELKLLAGAAAPLECAGRAEAVQEHGLKGR
uniref:RlsO n=1 Tax=Pandorina morum TaxID=33099 RepID=A0A1W5IWS7_PANMO|nr:rlsO [Pandorina morum]